MKMYEKVPVTIISMDESSDEGLYGVVSPQAYRTSITELIEFMAGMDLKDQIYMITNTLTIAGYSQREIAEAMGVSYKTYRNRLWEIRVGFKDRGVEEI
jgi:hypothetical protein